MSRRHESPTLTELVAPRAKEFQHYGTVVYVPIALDASVRGITAENLNQLLVDTMTLRDMYKKHHWQVSGPTFYQLHLLFDKHFNEQAQLVDAIAERIQTLGGVSIAMAHDVAGVTLIPRPPRGRDEGPVPITRLLPAREGRMKSTQAPHRQAPAAGDGRSKDLLVSIARP